jgi:hypothetical protein
VDERALQEAVEYCERMLDGPRLYSAAQWRDLQNGARKALPNLGEATQERAITIVAQRLSQSLGMDVQELEQRISDALGA